MGDINYATVCGLYCGECEHLGKTCRGCGYTQGKPFWAGDVPSGVCPYYDCCCNQKKLEHCGLCDDYPCTLGDQMRYPSWTDEQFAESRTQRQAALKRRLEIGTAAWLREVAGS